MIKKILSTLIFLVSFSISQDLKVVHMEGTYDLDGDGLKEFATIESGSVGGKQISVIRYYEVDENGYQEVNWEFEAPDGVLGNFVDVELGDLDGDGSPELITVSNITDGNDKEVISSKINSEYSKITKEINENSNIQMIIKNKKDEDILNLLHELIQDHNEQSNLRKIESLEQKLINNLDENSYSELIKLKSQLNRE